MTGRPAPTAWENYRAFSCQDCGGECIESWDLPWTKYRECEACFRVPLLENADRPSAIPSVDPALGKRRAEAGGQPAATNGSRRIGAGRQPAPMAEAGRQRGLAPDPEGEPLPRPEGGEREGGRCRGEAAAEAFLRATVRTDGGGGDR